MGEHEPIHPSLRRAGGLLLYELSSFHERLMEKKLAEFGIGRRELRVLWIVALSEHPPTQQVIADATNLSRSSIVFAIDVLEKLGVLQRTQNAGNRRENLISITVAGRRKFKLWQRLLTEGRIETFHALTSEEYDQLCDLLIRALEGAPSMRGLMASAD